LKVAFLTYEYESKRILGTPHGWKYGAGRYSESITQALIKLGIDVSVFTVNVGIRIVGPPLFWMKNALRDFRSFDIVHSNEIAGIFVKHPRKVEFSHHPYWHCQGWHRWITPFQLYAVKHATSIIVPSYYTAQALRQRLPSSTTITVIPHGVNREIFYPSPIERQKTRTALGIQDDFVVINVGRLEPHKRQIDIIRALSHIPNSTLILVGTGSLREYLISSAKKYGIKLLLYDRVSDNYLRALYNSADVYVHSSILEGFGLTIVESMACGLPVIAVKTADLDSVVGAAGYVVNQGKDNPVLRPLIDLAENEKERRRLGRIALHQSSKFDWTTAAKNHISVYEALLQQG